MTQVLIIGNLGQVGWEMQRALSPIAQVIGVGRGQIDLGDISALTRLVCDIAPDLIINCAAYTDVDRAETEQALAQAINVDAVAALGAAARLADAGVVHFSTNYVFSGSARQPYAEDDPTGPVSVYGRTKLAGEKALAATGCRYWTFRTSWVYSARGRNFVKAIVERAKAEGVLRIVSDQYGSPTWARALAQAVATLLVSRLGQPAALAQYMHSTCGLYHLTASGSTTWHEFAKFMVESLEDTFPPELAVLPMAAADFPTAAVRPRYAVLSNDRFAATFGFRLPDWRVGARLCAAELADHT